MATFESGSRPVTTELYSDHTQITPPPPTESLQELCASLHTQLEAFLAEEAPTELLRQVQKQTQTSLGVAKEAIEKFGYVCHLYLVSDLSSFERLDARLNVREGYCHWMTSR